MTLKKLFLTVTILFAGINSLYPQIKQRGVSSSYYMGIGYKFIYLTNSSARDAYPFFQLSHGDFLKEIDGYFGVVLNEKYGIEISPAYLFTNSIESDGYYYSNSSGRRFYLPVQTNLFAVPVNVRFKFFPFVKNTTSAMSKFYFGAGGGGMYINEEVTSQIYADENQLVYLGSAHAEDSFWTTNYEIIAGIGSFSKIGYGFELSYRFVPLNHDSNKPLITQVAGNFNSINFTANILFTF